MFGAVPPDASKRWVDCQTHAKCTAAILIGGGAETKPTWNVSVAAKTKKYVALRTRACRVETHLDARAALITNLSARDPCVEMSLDAARMSAYATSASAYLCPCIL